MRSCSITMSTPRRTQLKKCSFAISISVRTGLSLTLIAILTDRLWIYSRPILKEYVDSAIILDWVIEIGVIGLITVIMCFSVKFITKLSIQGILGLSFLNLKDSLKWSYVVFAASSFNYVLETPSGFGPQYKSELWFDFIRLLSTTLLIPIYEELIYRFLIYGWMRTKFKFHTAALGSSLIFFFAHQSVHKALTTSLWTTGVLFVSLFSYSLLAAYLYETRRTLLPCILTHAVLNFTYWSAPLIGFLWAGIIAQGGPPVAR